MKIFAGAFAAFHSIRASSTQTSYFNGSGRIIGTHQILNINGAIEVGDGKTDTAILESTTVNGSFKAFHAIFQGMCEINGDASSPNATFHNWVKILGTFKAENSKFEQSLEITSSKVLLDNSSIKEVLTVNTIPMIWYTPTVHLKNGSQVKKISFVGKEGQVIADSKSSVENIENGVLINR